MGGDLVNPSLSPNPQFSPNFPTYPLIFSYFDFQECEGMGGNGKGLKTGDKKGNFVPTTS
jgi:hypothetical protein